MLTAFMVNDIAWTEFSEPEEARPVDRVRLRCP